MRLLVVLVVAVLAGWEVFWWALGVRPVSPWHLKRIMANPETSPILLDVRTSSEYHWIHIPGAVNRPGVSSHSHVLDLAAAERPIVVICLSGHRSPIAGYLLKRVGRRNVSYLSWGMLSWLLSGGPVVKDTG